MNPAAQMRRNAFTLLELICAIGLISFLTVLAFSAFSRLGINKEATTCIQHLRQWGVAIFLYTGEHNGAFPPGDPNENANNNNGLFALVAVAPYMRLPITISPLTTGTPARFPGCPAKASEKRTENPHWYQSNYAWNPYLLSPPVRASTYGVHPRLSTLERSYILLGDTHFKHTFGYWDYVAGGGSAEPGWPAMLSYRHGNGAHLLWSDGSVGRTTENAVGHREWFY